MDQQDFHRQLEELFESDSGTVSAKDVLKDIEGWSSLTFLGLIAMLDQEYGVTLAPSTILACNTVADLQAAVEVRLGKGV